MNKHNPVILEEIRNFEIANIKLEEEVIKEMLFHESLDDNSKDIISRYDILEKRLLKFVDNNIKCHQLIKERNNKANNSCNYTCSNECNDKSHEKCVYRCTYMFQPRIKSKIKCHFKVIKDCINYYLNGDLEKALNTMYNTFIKPNDNETYLHYDIITEENRYFFRMRWGGETKLKKKDLFHIPFDLRGKVRNERFSMSGYPCLYVGTSLYGCYHETKPKYRKNKNIYYIKLKNTSDLRVLNLGIPTFFKQDKDNVLYASILINLALRLACSLKVPRENKEDSFHSEYIIPQLLLMSIIRKNSIADGASYAGLCYTSSHYHFYVSKSFKEIIKDVLDSANYVFPTEINFDNNNLGSCKKLQNIFKMTEVVKINQQTLTKKQLEKLDEEMNYDFKKLDDS